MRRAAALLLALVAVPATGTDFAERDVTATSVGYVTGCAEMDNVLVAFSDPAVTRFAVGATHPAYLAGRTGDDMAPDFTDCDFPPEPIWDYEPFTTVLWQDERVLLLGHRAPKSWRPEIVDFTVGDRTVSGLHLTQLFWKRRFDEGGPVEFLVLYPVDGYWRHRPAPPHGRRETGYGASFLIGPIEDAHRPFVRIREVTFEPETLTYRLDFVAGGSATLRVASLAPEGVRLDVTLERAPGFDRFAMLSSMFVTPDNADVARARVRRAGAAFWTQLAVDAFATETGTEFVFGRDIPSRHNYSAPDVSFGPFLAAE